MARKAKVAEGLDLSTFYTDSLDTIAKRQGFENSGLDVVPPMSSGMLAIDLITGGGFRPANYTGAGEEQCAKTTLALTVMGSAINHNIPLIAFVDYEGCCTMDTLLGYGKGKHARLDELFDLSKYKEWEPGTWPGQSRTDIDTVETGHSTRGTGVRSGSLYYRGEMPTSKVTLSNSATLTGYAHPFFVLTDEGLVEKKLEGLRPGDKVIVAKSMHGQDSTPISGLAPAFVDHYTLVEVVAVEPTGKTEPVFDVSLSGVAADEIPHSILTNGIVTHNSTKNSRPYVHSILKGMGIKKSMDEVFGKQDQNGKWVIPPIVRYRQETILERFYDWLSEVLRELPDKRYVEKKWWLVFDEKNKRHKAKVGDFVNPEMTRKYGNGLWVEAPDDKMQGIVFVDSYTAMTPECKDEEEISNQLSVKASAFSKQLERVKGRLAQKMVAVYGLNHLRSNPMAMFGPKESEKGGKALQQFSDVRFRQVSRSLSAAPFKVTKAKKSFDEVEPSVEFEGKLDTYRYVNVKAVKNKLWTPQRDVMMRIWVEDGSGTARGLCPVFDTIYYLKLTGQLKGTRAGFKLNLDGVGAAKKPIPWQYLKKWVLGDKEMMVKISKALGYPKPFSIRNLCFKQMREGAAERLYLENRNDSAPSEEGGDE